MTPRTLAFFTTRTRRVPSFAMSRATRSIPSFGSTDTSADVMISPRWTCAGSRACATTFASTSHSVTIPTGPFVRSRHDRETLVSRRHRLRGLEDGGVRRQGKEVGLDDVLCVEDHGHQRMGMERLSLAAFEGTDAGLFHGAGDQGRPHLSIRVRDQIY